MATLERGSTNVEPQRQQKFVLIYRHPACPKIGSSSMKNESEIFLPVNSIESNFSADFRNPLQPTNEHPKVDISSNKFRFNEKEIRKCTGKFSKTKN